jgi:hypothetical protein
MRFGNKWHVDPVHGFTMKSCYKELNGSCLWCCRSWFFFAEVALRWLWKITTTSKILVFVWSQLERNFCISYLTVLLHKIIVGLEGNLEGERHLHFLNFRTIYLQWSQLKLDGCSMVHLVYEKQNFLFANIWWTTKDTLFRPRSAPRMI